MADRIEGALACFMEGFSCSQAVFSAYAQELGLDTAVALKISCALGGGMGHIGETCGAVTGAFLVIGLKHGRKTIEDIEAREKTYRFVQQFAEKFKLRNRSIKCKELLPYDISTEEGLRMARENNLFRTICPKYVKDAVEIIEEIL